MPLKEHEFYVYYAGKKVFARRGDEAPVVAEVCASPQAAHDRVQEIVNPGGKRPEAFGPAGFNEAAFQKRVSENCRGYVEAAYRKAKRK